MKILNLPKQIFILLLMIHLTALNVQWISYLKLFTTTNISKDFDIEDEHESNSKSSESKNNQNDIDNEDEGQDKWLFHAYSESLFGYTNNLKNPNFAQYQCTIPQVHTEILIPPPLV